MQKDRTPDGHRTIAGRMKNVLLAAVFLAAASGCALPTASRDSQAQRMLMDDGAVKEVQAPSVRQEGSLWDENGSMNLLFVNPKASRIGDIVTVKIVESSKATNKATTNTKRASSVSAQVEKFLGLETKYPTANHPHWNPFGEIKGGLTSDFKGEGDTTRSGNLTAQITARVTEVLPSGNLRIRGYREVLINNEAQLITLTGIIRPRDISPDNVVLSSAIADARITYNGVGIVADRQRPGWLARFFDVIWPF